jgi:hypothetical protein
MQFRSPRELNDEIMAGLLTSLPDSSPRWLDVSTALLATLGVPRRKLDELAPGENDKSTVPNATALLAAQTLRKVPESQRREGIIRNMLKYSAVHVWGTAATLVPEFKDDALLLELLPGYLERQQKGALYVASWLIANGQTTLLEISLKAALLAMRAKDRDYNEISAACRMIIEHGHDDQYQEYLNILQQTKAHDTKRYGELWQVAWDESRSPRVVRILAVLLDDERRTSSWSDVRYCDFAGALLQRFSDEKFGFKEWNKMPLNERDEAVKRARAWMRRNNQSIK